MTTLQLLAYGLFSISCGVGIAKLLRRLFSRSHQQNKNFHVGDLEGWPMIAQRLGGYFRVFHSLFGTFNRESPTVARELRALSTDPRFHSKAFSSFRLGLSVLIGLITLLVGLLFKSVSDSFTLPQILSLGLVAFGLSFALVRLKLRERYEMMRSQVTREFPAFLDVLSISLESGQNFQAALVVALQRMSGQGTNGLKAQLEIIMRDMRSGRDRTQVLEAFAERLQLAEVTQFSAALITAERQGASISGILRRQSKQLRTSRALSAEKQAMKMPVKLLAPLAICIFPCTFLVLAFPIAIRLSESGLF